MEALFVSRDGRVFMWDADGDPYWVLPVVRPLHVLSYSALVSPPPQRVHYPTRTFERVGSASSRPLLYEEVP